MTSARRLAVVALAVALASGVSAGCSTEPSAQEAPTTSAAPTLTPAAPPATTPTAPPTTIAVTTTMAPATTTLPPTTTTPVTQPSLPVWDGSSASIAADAPTEFGRSVEGRPLTVLRRGDPNGVRVLVIGVIHGDEPAGFDIVTALSTAPLPAGIELWLVPAVNPDGLAADRRQNSNGVDLNRNFPENWGVVGEPGVWEYSGPSAASEPETQAMVALGQQVAPDLTLWYHQDLFRISPSSGRQGAVRARYAALTGLPLVEVSGGTYTGTASQWSRTVGPPDTVGFTVELGPTLSADEVTVHAEAVIVVGAEIAAGTL